MLYFRNKTKTSFMEVLIPISSIGNFVTCNYSKIVKNYSLAKKVV